MHFSELASMTFIKNDDHTIVIDFVGIILFDEGHDTEYAET